VGKLANRKFLFAKVIGSPTRDGGGGGCERVILFSIVRQRGEKKKLSYKIVQKTHSKEGEICEGHLRLMLGNRFGE